MTATTPATTPANTANRHRQIVSGLVILIIAIVVVWSIINISTLARHYHDTPATWLLGAAFGLANAVSVYVLATARTAKLKRPAIIGTVLFGLGSAIIQTNLYSLEGAEMHVAIAFGGLGPLAEALLAWMEAAMREELAEQEHDAMAVRLAAAAKENDALTAKIRQLESAKQTAKAPPTVRQIPATGGQLTATQIERCRLIAQLVREHRVTGPADLAELSDMSQRTAERYLPLAVEHGFVSLNGDGAYHVAQ